MTARSVQYRGHPSRTDKTLDYSINQVTNGFTRCNLNEEASSPPTSTKTNIHHPCVIPSDQNALVHRHTLHASESAYHHYGSCCEHYTLKKVSNDVHNPTWKVARRQKDPISPAQLGKLTGRGTNRSASELNCNIRDPEVHGHRREQIYRLANDRTLWERDPNFEWVVNDIVLVKEFVKERHQGYKEMRVILERIQVAISTQPTSRRRSSESFPGIVNVDKATTESHDSSDHSEIIRAQCNVRNKQSRILAPDVLALGSHGGAHRHDSEIEGNVAISAAAQAQVSPRRLPDSSRTGNESMQADRGKSRHQKPQNIETDSENDDDLIEMGVAGPAFPDVQQDQMYGTSDSRTLKARHAGQRNKPLTASPRNRPIVTQVKDQMGQGRMAQISESPQGSDDEHRLWESNTSQHLKEALWAPNEQSRQRKTSSTVGSQSQRKQVDERQQWDLEEQGNNNIKGLQEQEACSWEDNQQDVWQKQDMRPKGGSKGGGQAFLHDSDARKAADSAQPIARPKGRRAGRGDAQV